MAKFYQAKKAKPSLVISLLVIGLVLSTATQAQLFYSITDLGEAGYTEYRDINAAGQMTGWAIATDGTRHAFVTNNNGEKIDLGTLGGYESFGMATNSSGQVAGVYNDYRRAFVTNSSGVMSDVGDLGGNSGRITRAFGINVNGQVTGSSSVGDDIVIPPDYNTCDPRGGGCQPITIPAPQHAFVTTSNGALVDLGTLGGGQNSEGVDINDAGKVAGNSETSNGASHAFMTGNNQELVDLGTLGGNRSEAHAINASGQITGWAETADGSIHAFTTDSSGQMIDLLTLGNGGGINSFTLSNGIDINAAGQIVGEYFDSAGLSRPFVTENGNMMDLNTLLYGDTAGWDLQTVYAINDAGQILGSGARFFGGRNFLLTPISSVPLPATIWLFGSCLIGWLGLKRKVLAI